MKYKKNKPRDLLTSSWKICKYLVAFKAIIKKLFYMFRYIQQI